MDIECWTKKNLTQGLSPSLKVKSQIIPDTVWQLYWLAKVGNEQVTFTFSDFWFGEYTCSSGHLIYEAETMEPVSRCSLLSGSKDPLHGMNFMTMQ